MKFFSSTLITTILLVATLATGSAAELVTLPGSVWGIVPPPGFRLETSPVPLFRHPTGAIITVFSGEKRPISRSDFDGTPEQQAESRLESLTEVNGNGYRGYLAVIYYMKSRHTTVGMFVQGVTSNAAIAGVIPDGAKEHVSIDEITAALMTAVEKPISLKDRLAEFPIDVSNLAGMRVTDEASPGALELTNGPSNDSRATDQIFARVHSSEFPGGVRPDFAAELASLEGRIAKRYPGARGLESKVVHTENGEAAEIRYERPAGDTTVGGVTWAIMVGNQLVVMFCQYPLTDANALLRLAALRDGLKSKQAN